VWKERTECEDCEQIAVVEIRDLVSERYHVYCLDCLARHYPPEDPLMYLVAWADKRRSIQGLSDLRDMRLRLNGLLKAQIEHLVRDLRSKGVSHGKLATALRVSPARVSQILTGSGRSHSARRAVRTLIPSRSVPDRHDSGDGDHPVDSERIRALDAEIRAEIEAEQEKWGI